MPYATNAGVKIYYEVVGSGPPIALLHGIGDSSALWHELGAVERLQQNFTVVTIDSRGLGRSDQPAEIAAYERQHRRDDTIAVLDAIGADRVHLMGYSLGGRNALSVTEQQPDRIASVVVLSANPYPMALNRRVTADLRPAEPPRPPLAIRALRKGARVLLRRNRELSVQAKIAIADGTPVDIDTIAAAITMPAYFVTGDHDQLFSVELTTDFANRIEGARLDVVPGANHNVRAWFDGYLPMIEEFLLSAGDQAS